MGRCRAVRGCSGPALDQAASADAEVVWRPFRIDPAAPHPAIPAEEAWADPLVDAALARCAPGLTPAENRVRVSRIAAAEGLSPWRGAAWRTDSHHAHRLMHLAYEHGGAPLQNALAEQVMDACFRRGADIGDPARLKEIATGCGFAEGAALLDTDAGDRKVRELLLIGKARAVRTSPTLVVGDRALAGAQPPEVVAEFLTASAASAGSAAGSGGDRARAVPPEVRRLRWVESLLDQSDPLGALTLLAPLLDAHGEDPNVLRLAARGYFHSAQLSRARAVLDVLVARTPDDSYARLMLGSTLRRLGRDDEAARQLKTAAAMTPEFV
ncbi:DsbA family protein [Streptomyces sp. NPDC046887]|uniref:DsbA family protein n=1 Tax=Streptomyces sp. NPDC046887 TaxID=3155472 RepID=UPI0033EB251B